MFEQTIINKLQDHFGITSNGLREQLEREVYDELAKVRVNLEKDVEYRKKILSDANFAKLEQARLTNELAEKFFKDDIKLENLRKEYEDMKNHTNNEVAENAIAQVAPSNDALSLANPNHENSVLAAQITKELQKNNEMIEKNKAEAIAREEENKKGFLASIFKKPQTVSEEDEELKLSTEQDLSKIGKNLEINNDENLAEDLQGQKIEDPAKIEKAEERSVSFNEVVAFIRNKEQIESPFASGTFTNANNAKYLYDNFSQMDINELKVLLSQIKAKNQELERQLAELKGDVIAEVTNALGENDKLTKEIAQTSKVSDEFKNNKTIEMESPEAQAPTAEAQEPKQQEQEQDDFSRKSYQDNRSNIMKLAQEMGVEMPNDKASNVSDELHTQAQPKNNAQTGLSFGEALAKMRNTSNDNKDEASATQEQETKIGHRLTNKFTANKGN